MSDGIAPAIDKVGEPAPTAPEAEVAAPTIATAAPTSDPKPDEKKAEDDTKASLHAPKPVEMMSVPQTPINNGTPAGGTPRPELKIDAEPKEKPKEEEAPVILGIQEPQSTPVDSVPKESELLVSEPIPDKPAEASTNGSSKDVEMTGVLPSSGSSESATGEKRKLEDEPSGTNGEASSSEKSGSDERSDKKARVEDALDKAATNGKSKAKREKKAAAQAAQAAGRTARKTRSQGPVEV